MGTSNVRLENRLQVADPVSHNDKSGYASHQSNPPSQGYYSIPQQPQFNSHPGNDTQELNSQDGGNQPQGSNASQMRNIKSSEALEEEVQDEFTKQVNELIIQPSEGPQTSFYCIKESGGKIGRHSSNQILILEESISRYHAEIQFKNGEFYLQDIGSTTGTFIKVVD